MCTPDSDEDPDAKLSVRSNLDPRAKWKNCTGSDHDRKFLKIEHRIRIHGLNDSCVYRWNLKNDHSEQLIPEPGSSVQHIDLDPQALYMAVVNNKVQWASNQCSGIRDISTGSATLQKRIIVWTVWIYLVLCCVSDPDWIRIQLCQWIRSKKCHVLKCWMFSFEGWRRLCSLDILYGCLGINEM